MKIKSDSHPDYTARSTGIMLLNTTSVYLLALPVFPVAEAEPTTVATAPAVRSDPGCDRKQRDSVMVPFAGLCEQRETCAMIKSHTAGPVVDIHDLPYDF